MKKHTFIIFALFIILSQIPAESPFVVIMYDSLSEKNIGSFPPNRKIWADTINKLKEYNAKAIVLKFFFDLPKQEDELLSKSINNIPTFLQACFNENEPSNNQLDSRFVAKIDSNYKNVISGNKGWLPVPVLSQNAYDIGFVDLKNVNDIPIIEKYNNHYVKSLYFSVLQYMLPELKLTNNTLINKNKRIVLNKYLEMHINYPKIDSLKYVSLYDVLNNKVDKSIFYNKIVIIGYDGINSQTITLTTGQVKMHRAFVYGLYDMYNQLNEGNELTRT